MISHLISSNQGWPCVREITCEGVSLNIKLLLPVLQARSPDSKGRLCSLCGLLCLNLTWLLFQVLDFAGVSQHSSLKLILQSFPLSSQDIFPGCVCVCRVLWNGESLDQGAFQPMTVNLRSVTRYSKSPSSIKVTLRSGQEFERHTI